jgi:hypothetical protein
MTEAVVGTPVAGAAPPVALETLTEAATNRLDALRNDPAFGAKRLAGDHAARNEHSTLLQILHGEGLDDAARSALAASIQLTPRPTLAAATRAKAEAQAAAAASAVKVPFDLASKLGPEGAATLAGDAGAWLDSLGLPSSIRQTVSNRITEMGPRVGKMSADEQREWTAKQDAMLLGSAHGDQAIVDKWHASAKKVLAGSKYAAALITRDSFIVRALALVGDARTK